MQARTHSCTHTHTLAHAHAHAHTRTRTCKRTCIRTYTRARSHSHAPHLNMNMNMDINMNMNIDILIFIFIYMYKIFRFACIYIYICIQCAFWTQATALTAGKRDCHDRCIRDSGRSGREPPLRQQLNATVTTEVCVTVGILKQTHLFDTSYIRLSRPRSL